MGNKRGVPAQIGAVLKVPLVKMGLTMDIYVESFNIVPFTKAVK
jgi:hypothetical protein